MVVLSRFTSHENILSYKLEAKEFLFEIASASDKGLSITVLPTSLVFIVRL